MPSGITKLHERMLLSLPLDVLDVIFGFLEIESKLIIHRTCKDFINYQVFCSDCSSKPILPIVINGEINCYKCIENHILCEYDKILWEKFDNLSVNSKNRCYMKCEQWNIKCKNSDWYHYHKYFKCKLR